MVIYELKMPKLGESIIEATITRWLKKVGDQVGEDEALVEIATDKVDSEIPSPVEGLLKKVFFKEGDIVPVGDVIAEIEISGESDNNTRKVEDEVSGDIKNKEAEEEISQKPPSIENKEDSVEGIMTLAGNNDERFLSPLVKSIAKSEGITSAVLESIQGTGKDGRLTKNDLLRYLDNHRNTKNLKDKPSEEIITANKHTAVSTGNDEVFEMDRMRRLIADHMVMSVKVSPHVTSFVEVDMTKIVKWRESIKSAFEEREGEKLTYTPIIIEAAARALRDYPGVNASVDGYNIIIRGRVNIGMATNLPDGNLIVPVIHDADKKNLSGLAGVVNDLARRARSNQLKPDEIQGGSFTVTNLGSFNTLTGTPVINQPQVAILAIGAIRKMPAVIETPEGDMIAVRHKMILALTYDHRVVDGGLGGNYLKRVAEYLENFETKRTA